MANTCHAHHPWTLHSVGSGNGLGHYMCLMPSSRPGIVIVAGVLFARREGEGSGHGTC